MHRPDLTFKPVIKKQQWYFGFNKESGQVIYCGVVKKGNCIEITESLIAERRLGRAGGQSSFIFSCKSGKL